MPPCRAASFLEKDRISRITAHVAALLPVRGPRCADDRATCPFFGDAGSEECTVIYHLVDTKGMVIMLNCSRYCLLAIGPSWS